MIFYVALASKFQLQEQNVLSLLESHQGLQKRLRKQQEREESVGPFP